MKSTLIVFSLLICYFGCDSITEPTTNPEERIYYYTSPKIVVFESPTDLIIESALVEALGYNQKKVTNQLGEVVFVFSFASSKGESIEVEFCISHSSYLTKTVKMACASGTHTAHAYAHVNLEADETTDRDYKLD
jgi:hypothetical protein